MEDDLIVNMYLERNEKAIELTRSKYGKYIHCIASRFLNNRSDVEECENDVYMAIWESVPPNEPRSHFRAYLAKITRNHAVSLYRKHNNKSEEVENILDELNMLGGDFDVENEYLARELGKAINEFLGKCDVKNRKVFVSRYFLCESISEIASKQVIPEGTVKTMLYRTRIKLAKYLKKKGYEII